MLEFSDKTRELKKIIEKWELKRAEIQFLIIQMY